MMMIEDTIIIRRCAMKKRRLRKLKTLPYFNINDLDITWQYHSTKHKQVEKNKADD